MATSTITDDIEIKDPKRFIEAVEEAERQSDHRKAGRKLKQELKNSRPISE